MELNELYERLCGELCEMGGQELSMEKLKVIDTLAHAAKNIKQLKDEGFSFRSSYRGSYGNGSGNSYNQSNGSYNHSMKRDSMGRYSRGNNVTDGLRELMKNAPEEMRGEIEKLASRLENM